MAEDIYVFDGATLHLVDYYNHDIQVADSFLVVDGRVRSLGRHMARFNDAAEKISSLDLGKFWEEALKLIPRTGQFFPRLELAADNLVFRLREPTDFRKSVILWTADEVDERIDPTIKGPDLAYGAKLRRKANLFGADEAVILNQQGQICEGALSSIVWWKDDVLYAPNQQTRWLPSVTRMDVFDLANQAGYEASTDLVRPEDLIGLEIWSLSSLTGIRPVTEWLDLGGSVGAPKHLESFQRRLKLMSEDIDS